tara:strand:- start:2136 stop:2912 length:777 start_codon:yes stop_codon:yes gene_type:complete
MVLGSRNTVVHSSYISEQETHASIDFDGAGDFVTVGNVGTVKMLSFWFSPDSELGPASSITRLMQWYSIGGSTYFGIHISDTTGILTNETLTLMINAQTRVGAINYTFSAGAWFHVFCSWSDTNDAWNLYINGVNVGVAASGDGSAQTLADFTAFKWGRDGGSSNMFNGKMTDVAIWDTSYDAAGDNTENDAIAGILYNGGVPHDPRIASGDYTAPIIAQLTGYWRSNEGTGTNVEDLVGSNDGTITNATWSTNSPYS